MIALDTNVLVRYTVGDDVRQAAAAAKVIESQCTADDPGFISLIVLCELVWVLDRGYGYTKPSIAGTLRTILGSDDLMIEESDTAWQALNLYEQGKGDFADYLIGLVAKKAGSTTTFTFDRRALDSGLFTTADSGK